MDRLTLESHERVAKGSDPAGRSLVKRCQESQPALIYMSIFFFISASPERIEIPLVEKRERH